MSKWLSKKILLRPVRAEDCHLVWQWTNDITIRNASFSSNFIDWKTHVEWFNAKLQDFYCYYWIAVDNNNTSIGIGQVRFDLDLEVSEAIISLSISPSFQGYGYGKILLKEASKKIFEQTSIKSIKAFIKSQNQRSIHTFENNGFRKIAETEIKGCPSLIYMKFKEKNLD